MARQRTRERGRGGSPPALAASKTPGNRRRRAPSPPMGHVAGSRVAGASRRRPAEVDEDDAPSVLSNSMRQSDPIASSCAGALMRSARSCRICVGSACARESAPALATKRSSAARPRRSHRLPGCGVHDWNQEASPEVSGSISRCTRSAPSRTSLSSKARRRAGGSTQGSAGTQGSRTSEAPQQL